MCMALTIKIMQQHVKIVVCANMLKICSTLYKTSIEKREVMSHNLLPWAIFLDGYGHNLLPQATILTNQSLCIHTS